MSNGWKTEIVRVSSLVRYTFINRIIILVLVILVSLLCSCITVPPIPGPDIYYPTSFLELQRKASSPSYDDLFRYNERYIGKLVYYRAEIVQVIEVGENVYRCRADVTNKIGIFGSTWEDTVYIRDINFRLLEDDIIEFVGEVMGLQTYTSVLRGKITIPDINVIEVLLRTKAGNR